MARQNNQDNGCGCILLLAIVIFVLVKGDGQNPGSTNTESVSAGALRFVSASKLNCRSVPDSSGAIVTSLAFAEGVSVTEETGGWSRIDSPSGECWASSSYLGTEAPSRTVEPSPVARESKKAPHISVAAIKRLIIQQSIDAYPGNCPCPYNTDRAGRRCGLRSAYDREGGYAPLCYPADVSDADVEAFKKSIDN
ncbi:MAG TPA: SH3 domain-containing protein [Sphingomicrobium sp.]|nr:SH3 domain-containing protein [Sphingomicrobium sp.]